MDRRQALIAIGLGAAGLAAIASGKKKKPVHCIDGKCHVNVDGIVDVSVNELKRLAIDTSYGGETPAVDLPESMRMKNWGGGSCVHASTVNLLNWQGLHEMADWWRKTYSGGEYATRLNQRMEQAGLRWAYTASGDVSFLDWCHRTRRGAGIGYFPSHAINCVHFDETEAGLLDNNRPGQYIWVPRQKFITNWKGYGGWAFTVVYTPPPPVPFV